MKDAEDSLAGRQEAPDSKNIAGRRIPANQPTPQIRGREDAEGVAASSRAVSAEYFSKARAVLSRSSPSRAGEGPGDGPASPQRCSPRSRDPRASSRRRTVPPLWSAGARPRPDFLDRAAPGIIKAARAETGVLGAFPVPGQESRFKHSGEAGIDLPAAAEHPIPSLVSRSFASTIGHGAVKNIRICLAAAGLAAFAALSSPRRPFRRKSGRDAETRPRPMTPWPAEWTPFSPRSTSPATRGGRPGQKNGRILLRKGYGLADMELNVVLPTFFRLGSITKQFTAVGILKLAEQGKLVPRRRCHPAFLPGYPTGGKPSTGGSADPHLEPRRLYRSAGMAAAPAEGHVARGLVDLFKDKPTGFSRASAGNAKRRVFSCRRRYKPRRTSGAFYGFVILQALGRRR